jgi:mannobiose 2-epimerase
MTSAALLSRLEGGRDTILRQGAELRRRLQTILDTSIVPFWRRAEVSAETGCQVEFDWRGRALPAGNRNLVSQATMLMYFALLARRTGDPAMVDAAGKTFEFMIDRLWDREYGGFFWDAQGASLAGQPSEREPVAWLISKHLLAQALALSAIAEFGKTTGSDRARSVADDLFEFILRVGKPDGEGFFVESFARDLSPTPPYRFSPVGQFHAAGPSHACHMHFVEGFDAYRRLVDDERAAEWTKRVIAALQAQAVGDLKNRNCRLVDAYDVWGSRTAVPGHIVKEIWFCLRAETDMNGSGNVAAEYYGNMFHATVLPTFDRRRGGFYEYARRKPRNNRPKIWWLQAEGLVCCLYLALELDDAAAADCFLKTLDWIERKQVDWRHGEWHAKVEGFFPCREPKGDNWKTAYHGGRAMLECLRRLEAADGRLA